MAPYAITNILIKMKERPAGPKGIDASLSNVFTLCPFNLGWNAAISIIIRSDLSVK